MATNKYYKKVLPKLPLIMKWCRAGLNDLEICDRLKIKKSSYYEYKKKYPEFNEVVRKGKEYADAEVENQLYKNCIGYEYTEEVQSTKKEVIYENGKRVKEIVQPVVIELRKYRPSETNAAKFWLTNREKENWKDKQDVDISTNKPFDVNIKVVK